MASGARSKFGVPMFEPEVFRKQMYFIEESTCDIVGTFRSPEVIRGPRNCAPLAPVVATCVLLWACCVHYSQTSFIRTPNNRKPRYPTQNC